MRTSKVNGALRLAGALALIGLAAIAAPHAQSRDTNASRASEADYARLTSDVSRLQVEVLQIRIELEGARLGALEGEVRRVEEHLRSVAAEDQSLRQEAEDLQRQLLDPRLSSEQRAQITITAADAWSTGITRLGEERETVERRHAALRGQLAQAYQTRARLLARAADLGIPASGQTIR